MLTQTLPRAGYREHVLGTQQEDRGAAQWQQPTMTDAQLFRIIGDARGPEVITSSLSDDELARLLDALYRNLDTRVPEPCALFWYDIGVEESLRRAH
jgi:hypothetical protein